MVTLITIEFHNAASLVMLYWQVCPAPPHSTDGIVVDFVFIDKLKTHSAYSSHHKCRIIKSCYNLWIADLKKNGLNVNYIIFMVIRKRYMLYLLFFFETGLTISSSETSFSSMSLPPSDQSSSFLPLPKIIVVYVSKSHGDQVVMDVVSRDLGSNPTRPTCISEFFKKLHTIY